MRRAHTVFLAALCSFVVVSCGLGRDTSTIAVEEPTPVPSVEESTPLPPTPIPGFARYEGLAMEIWLPDSYVGGDPNSVGAELAAELTSAGVDNAAGMVEDMATNVNLWAFDSAAAHAGVLPTVTVRYIPYLRGATLDWYTKVLVDSLPSAFVLAETQDVEVPEYLAQRMLFNTEDQGGRLLAYVLRRGERAWVLLFAAPSGRVDELAPVFEQSVLTFRDLG